MDRRPTSIDGFVNYQPNRPHKPKPFLSGERLRGTDRQPEANRPALSSRGDQPPSVRTKIPASFGNPQQNQPSLLSMAIPNPQYAKPDHTQIPSRKKKKWSRKRKVVTTILSIFIVLLGLTGWFGTRLIGQIDKVFHGNIFSDVQALFSKANLKSDANGRVNILIAGNSVDDPNHSGAMLTDSIMVLSVDTKNHTAFLLSVPRDLWVYIPALNENQKINDAITASKFSLSGYPSGGVGALEQVVQTELDVPIDYYAVVDYTAFKDAVNAIGGININIQSGDSRGLYDSYTNLKLPNGNDTLNGQQALDLARARCDSSAGDVCYGFPNSDFSRTQHQRDMAIAIAKKATSLGVVSNPVKVSSLFSALAKNVQTDLSLQDALTLASITKNINLNNIGSYTYAYGGSSPLIRGYIDPVTGEDALAPVQGPGNFSQIQAFYQSLISANPTIKESATITLLNGTDVNGIAKQEQGVLTSRGLTNIAVGDTSALYPSSMIVDNSNGKDPNTKQLLQQLFPGSTVTSTSGSTEAAEGKGYTTTFIVIIGQNFVNSNSSSSTGSYTGG